MKGTKPDREIRNKVGLLKLAQALGNVTLACKIMGYSRYSFYSFKKLYELGGELALHEISSHKPCTKNQVAREVEKVVCRLALKKPSWGQLRISNELRAKGIFISPSGVRSVWLRHNLETFPKRLKASRGSSRSRRTPAQGRPALAKGKS